MNNYEFIEEYQKHECLWRKSSPFFKNRAKRDAAEAALLEASGIASVKLLRQKIRSIRGTYNQERAKVRASNVTGSGSSEVYKPRLLWYNLADTFLRQNEANETESNLEITQADNSNSELFGTEETVTPTHSHSTTTEQRQTEECLRELGPGPKRKRKANQQSLHLGDSLDNAVKVLQEVTQRSQQSNEFSYFGQHVASQLQALPIREALQLQADIQNLITSVRMRALPPPPYCQSSPGTSNGNIIHVLSDEQIIAPVEDREIDECVSETAPDVTTFFTNWNDDD